MHKHNYAIMADARAMFSSPPTTEAKIVDYGCNYYFWTGKNLLIKAGACPCKCKTVTC